MITATGTQRGLEPGFEILQVLRVIGPQHPGRTMYLQEKRQLKILVAGIVAMGWQDGPCIPFLDVGARRAYQATGGEQVAGVGRDLAAAGEGAAFRTAQQHLSVEGREMPAAVSGFGSHGHHVPRHQGVFRKPCAV
ncbi:MAG: hypothetical protein BWK76_15290 [Desulfobulbaceae bacterium A2]|nr:MAG: hypothetical protein BWK76_15290 [Desulfobulbaceae bacterium A2]